MKKTVRFQRLMAVALALMVSVSALAGCTGGKKTDKTGTDKQQSVQTDQKTDKKKTTSKTKDKATDKKLNSSQKDQDTKKTDSEKKDQDTKKADPEKKDQDTKTDDAGKSDNTTKNGQDVKTGSDTGTTLKSSGKTTPAKNTTGSAASKTPAKGK